MRLHYTTATFSKSPKSYIHISLQTCRVGDRLSARGLTYNNNSGQLSIEYLRPDPTSQFSKRVYTRVRQLRQHVASQVRRETGPLYGCQARLAAAAHCPYPKPDPLPNFTGSLSYVFHDVAKVGSLHAHFLADLSSKLMCATVKI